MIRNKKEKVSNSKKLICTDAAKFSLKGIIPRQKSGFRHLTENINLKYRGYGNKMFDSAIDVLLNGEKVGTMEAHPRQLLNPDTVIFQTDNRLQYQSGWTEKLKTVFQDLNLSFSHINQLDIAVDEIDNNSFKFVNDYISGKIRKVGRAVLTFQMDHDDGDKPNLRYFRVGGRGGDKYIRGYYKRQELAQSNKHYISEWWEANGFDLKDDQEVARFEIALKRRELKKIIEADTMTTDTLHWLEDPEYLATLFNTSKKDFFEFVRRSEYKRTGNTARCKRLKVFDLKEICSHLLNKMRSRVTTDIYKAKMAAKFLYQIYLKVKDPRYLLEVEEVLHNFNLNRWFAAAQDSMDRDFHYKMKSGAWEFLTKYTSDPKFVQARIWNRSTFMSNQ